MGSELYWVPRVTWEHLVATKDHNWLEAQRHVKEIMGMIGPKLLTSLT